MFFFFSPFLPSRRPNFRETNRRKRRSFAPRKRRPSALARTTRESCLCRFHDRDVKRASLRFGHASQIVIVKFTVLVKRMYDSLAFSANRFFATIEVRSRNGSGIPVACPSRSPPKEQVSVPFHNEFQGKSAETIIEKGDEGSFG